MPPQTSSEPVSPSEAGPEASTAPVAGGGGWIDASIAGIRVDEKGMRGCTGVLTDATKTYFRQAFEAAQKCVETERAGAKGSVLFHSTIEAGGGMSEFAVEQDQLKNPKVVDCLQNAIFDAEYPKVPGDTPCVQLRVPVVFD